MEMVKVNVVLLVEEELVRDEYELEVHEDHTGEDMLGAILTVVSKNEGILLALTSDNTSLNEEWDKVLKDSELARVTVKATCSEEELERLMKLEERIKEATEMLKKESNNNTELKGGNEMKEELNTVIEATFEQVEAELKEIANDIETAQKSLSDRELKEIFTSKDGDAYKILLAKLDDSYESTKSFLGDCAVVKEIAKRNDAVKNKVNEFLSKHGNAEKVVAIIGGLIRKIAASLLGLAKFTFETVTLLATMVLRIGFVIGEEVIDTTVAIGGSFNKNVLGLFRRKK